MYISMNMFTWKLISSILKEEKKQNVSFTILVNQNNVYLLVKASTTAYVENKETIQSGLIRDLRGGKTGNEITVFLITI